MGKHSPIGASKAHRWVNCPGTVKASEGCPDKSGDAASLGTGAHLLGEMTIQRGLRSPRLWDYPEQVEGKEGHMHTVDEDMLQAVETYTNYVFEARKEDDDVMVETRFSLAHIHPELYGTNDCMIIRPMEMLHVMDYKNGSGSYVEVVEGEYDEIEHGIESIVMHPEVNDVNPQLLIYALGGLNSIIDPVLEVKLTIIQPRCEADFKIRSVVLSAQAVRAWGDTVLKDAAHACYLENPHYKIGHWCRYCPAEPVCPAKLEAAFGLTKVNPIAEPTSSVVFPLPTQMTAKELLAVNQFANAFKTWTDSVNEFIRHQLETGKMTSAELGMKLVEGRKSKVWKEGYQQILLSNGILEKGELYNEPKPKSPAQMDALLKDEHGFSKEERDNLLKPAYTEQPGNSRLVPLSAKGDELKPSAQIAFQQFDNEKD